MLVAKVKAHLCRIRGFPDDDGSREVTTKGQSCLQFLGHEIKLDSAVVKVNGSIVKLSAKEFQLLCFMAQNPGRIYSVEQLFG